MLIELRGRLILRRRELERFVRYVECYIHMHTYILYEMEERSAHEGI